MNTKTSLFALLGVLACIPSCVSPGSFDQGVITRYQEKLAARGPQPRGDGGLRPLEPASRMPQPTLKVVKQGNRSVVYLSLDQAIMRALANSLDIRVVSFDPQISREQAIQAAAAFDVIVFGSTSYTKVDTGAPASQPANEKQTKTLQYQVGARQTLITGGTWEIAPTLTRNWQPEVTTLLGTSGGTSWTPSLELKLEQPLLRNAGPDFTLARLRIAQLNVQNSSAQFRQTVEETINSVINAYWALMQARVEVQIQQELLNKTIETFERIRERLEIDASYVELKQAEAAVEQRRATLYRAKKTTMDAQDQLARILADSQLNVLTKYEIIPSTSPTIVPLQIDATDQLVLTLANSPLLEQARLAIAAAEINIRVAKNQTLPRLDFQASASLGGSEENLGDAFGDTADLNHIGYSLALVAEYPLGNRAALAELARQRFERLKAITTYQTIGDQIAQQINERIRQVDTTFMEMQAEESAIRASTAQLDALQNTEEIRGKLTPEFLQVKLSAQEVLANAQRGKLAAVVQYNSALADLARLTGTILLQHGIDVRKMPAAMGEAPWPPEAGPMTPATVPSIPTAASIQQGATPPPAAGTSPAPAK